MFIYVVVVVVVSVSKLPLLNSVCSPDITAHSLGLSAYRSQGQKRINDLGHRLDKTCSW